MPGFTGFSKELPKYFRNLKKNNSKQWFEKHRSEYDEFVLFAARDFVVAMGDRLRKIAPGINAIPKINQSLFKINRDVRFSKDKSPYKTNMGIWFWDGRRKRMECPGFYFHFEDRSLRFGTGFYMFPRNLLTVYRDAVVDKKLGAALKRAVKKVADQGYTVGGRHYKRIPRGYDADHPNAEFLLYNGLHAMQAEKIPEAFFSGALIEHAFGHYKNMLPLHQWLLNVMDNK
jgi:uncharacterized protein (TIGR02453 family)